MKQKHHHTAILQWTALIAGLTMLSTAIGCGGSSTPPQVAGSEQIDSGRNEPVTTTQAVDSQTSDESQVQVLPAATALTADTTSISPTDNDQSNPERSVAPQRFRLPDDRPKLNAEEFLSHGLRIVESKHLILVTDLPQESVAELPRLADALFAYLELRLGKLPSNLAGTEFQVTGFLMDARDRFKQAGMLPPEEFTIRHGRHLGYQFWINNQPADYYRRHLLLP